MPNSITDIQQGDIYWIRPEESAHEELGHYPHPYVILQDTLLNRSRVSTVVVCALSTNRRHFNEPGNVLLDAGEANLPKQSVVEVSKISSVQKTYLGDYIGTLDPHRIQQIFAGIRFLQTSFFNR